MKPIQRILLVDDSEAEHIIAQVAVEEFDDSIVLDSAYDGEEALAFLLATSTPPDIILVDINMPRMNGIEFLEAYAKVQSDKTSVVAVLSSSSQPSDKQTCLQYDFVKDFVSKPLETVDIAKISSYLA